MTSRDAAAKPMPATPEEAVALKEAGTSWSNEEIRHHYHRLIAAIPIRDQQLAAEHRSMEERARAAFEGRHNARITCRAMMRDEAEVAALRLRDQQKYGNPDGPTFEQLVASGRAKGRTGDALYQAIIDSSQRTDQATDEAFGIRK